ncbi:MAG: hypothetical protein JWP76_5883 [Dactylosporangium sp.]|nr:hypothetical protein [Dactylosporangium sp.]
MLPRTYDQINCSIARTMEVVGDRWTLLVVRNALVGMTRFDEFQRSLDIAPNVLTDRLARLTEEGILERRQYSQRPPRYEYHPTAKGRDLWPLLTAMVEWGDRHYAPNGAPRLLLHADCGQPIVQQLICTECDTTVTPDEITTMPGPGAQPAVA